MGEVYKARDNRLDRMVAIKLSKQEFSERFEREAHGREMFFISDMTQRPWAAGIRPSAGRVEIEPPRPLFPVVLFPGPANIVNDVTPDGRRFVVVSAPGAQRGWERRRSTLFRTGQRG
jgi:hypothetical protein